METEAAQRISSFALRYAFFDCDSFAYRGVCFIYGIDKVVKYKCINNVGKRMGTRLRKLKGNFTSVTILPMISGWSTSIILAALTAARAAGRVPHSHSQENLFLRIVPQAALQKTRVVYEDLTKNELLSRCLPGNTQNINVSLHSKVWHAFQGKSMQACNVCNIFAVLLPWNVILVFHREAFCCTLDGRDPPPWFQIYRHRRGSEGELQSDLSDVTPS